jgi:hypothetical protein
MKKTASRLITAASLLSLLLVTPASAAVAAISEGDGLPHWQYVQGVLSEEGHDFAGNVGLVYDFTAYNFQEDPAYSPGSMPAGDRFSQFGLSSVPSFFGFTEQNERGAYVVNYGDQPLTLTDVQAEVFAPKFPGASATTSVVPAGTSLLTAPVAPRVVAPGETAYINFPTAEPVVSVVRTNDSGAITGVGSAVRYSFTLEGRTYRFDDVRGFSSASTTTGSEATLDAAMFGDCTHSVDGSTLPVIDITGCAWAEISGAGVTYEQPALIPVPEVPTPETPAPEVPTPETPAPEVPTPETPAPEVPTPETPAYEVPTPETPAPEVPTPETPAPEVPTPETPAPEVPAPELPEVPTPETPAPEAPTSDRPELPKTGFDGMGFYLTVVLPVAATSILLGLIIHVAANMRRKRA